VPGLGCQGERLSAGKRDYQQYQQYQAAELSISEGIWTKNRALARFFIGEHKPCATRIEVERTSFT
ncbi:MAG: hypothetical protein ABW153_15345, partial [Sedimenticola sp.]